MKPNVCMCVNSLKFFFIFPVKICRKTYLDCRFNVAILNSAITNLIFFHIYTFQTFTVCTRICAHFVFYELQID